MELGLCTFADMLPDKPGSGVNAHQRISDLLEEIKLADELGLDVFGIGEHHRPDYSVSAPSIILAAAAAITKNIKLSSAVTVLSSDDPVRVYQHFSTIDHLSHGRAEIMVGRGSFIESFPLFGYDLNDYNELFTEKLALLLQINKDNENISWKGNLRPSIDNRGVYPHSYQEKLPIWIAAGGTPASAVRAANLGLPLTLAIIGGLPEQFVPFANLYKETAKKNGQDPAALQFAVNSHAYVTENSQNANKEFYPYYAAMMNAVGKDRGWSTFTEGQFDFARSQTGALVVGSPEEVVDKILYEHELFGNTRFIAQSSLGTLPHKQVMKSIELFGTKVAPAVRKALL